MSAPLEKLMPNVAGRTGAGPDAGKLADYRARSEANRSAVTPMLKDIQGRRTGVIIGKRISKDSEGFEDIDAFWELASEGDNDAGRAGAGARLSTASAISDSSLELGLSATPSTTGRRSSTLGVRTRRSSVPMRPPAPSAAYQDEDDGANGEEEEAKTSPTKGGRKAAASRPSTRRSSGASPLALSLGADTPAAGGGGGASLDPSELYPTEATGETPAAIAGGPKRLDFLARKKLSLGGGATPKPAKAASQEEEEGSEAATEEEVDAAAAAAAAAAAGGFGDDDWAAGGDDDFGPPPEDEADLSGAVGVDDEEEEEQEQEEKTPAATAKGKGKGAKKQQPQQQQQKKKKAAASAKPRQSEGGEDTELSAYEEDDEDEAADPTRTGERRRRGPPQPPTRKMRYTEFHNKNKPLLDPNGAAGEDEEGGGVGPMGERRSTRRRMPVLKWWMGERAVYETEKVAQAADGMGGRKGTEMEVEVRKVRDVELANTPEPSFRRRRAGSKKRKATGAQGGKDGKAARLDNTVLPMNPEKIIDAHPTYNYARNGKAKVWDEKKALRVTKRIVAAKDDIQMRALASGGYDGTALEAGHAFRVLQVARQAEDREAHDPGLVGYPGWVAGRMVVKPRKGKVAENVGPCSQVFHVLAGQANALELAVADTSEAEEGGAEAAQAFDEEAATRFLLSPGDTFQLPAQNVYKLYNHSKKVEAEVFWVIIKPWTEETGEEEETAPEPEPEPVAAAPKSASKGRQSLAASASKQQPPPPSSAKKAAKAAEEDEEVEGEVSSEDEEEEGDGEQSEDIMSESEGEEESEAQPSSGSDDDDDDEE